MMTVDKQDVCFEDAIEIQFADLQEKTLGSLQPGLPARHEAQCGMARHEDPEQDGPAGNTDQMMTDKQDASSKPDASPKARKRRIPS